MIDSEFISIFTNTFFKSINLILTRPKEELPKNLNYYLKWINILIPHRIEPFPQGPTVTSHEIANEFSALLRVCLFRNNQAIDLIKEFLSTIWDKRILDYHPGIAIYKGKNSGAISILRNIFQLKVSFSEYKKYLKKLESEWNEILESPSTFIRECEKTINSIKNIYEGYRYAVGFLLALSNIEENLSLPNITEYFDDHYNTSDGIYEFFSRNLKKIGSKTLDEYLPSKFSALHTFFVNVLYKYTRIQRIYASHKILDLRQTKVQNGIYIIRGKKTTFEFSWSELATIFNNLYEIYKLLFLESLKILPEKIRNQIIIDLSLQEIQNPLTEEVHYLLENP